METKNELNAQSYRLLKHHKIINILAKREIVEKHIKNIHYNEEKIDVLRSELMSKLGVKTKDELREKLLENKIEELDYYESRKKTLGLKEIATDMFKQKAKARFLERKHIYDVGSYSLIRVKNAFKAREILLRIKENEESFEDLATKYSEGPERYNRGVVGPGPIEKANPELAKIVRGSRLGETRGPFQIGEWAVIIRLNNLALAKYDSKLEETICSELFEEHINSQARNLMQEWEEIFEPNRSAKN